MDKKIWLLVIVIVSLSFGYWKFHGAPDSSETDKTSPPVQVQTVIKNKPPAPQYNTPVGYLNYLHSESFLKPDNRVLIAVRELLHLLTGKVQQIEFRRHNENSWSITGSTLVNQPRLKDLAGFANIKAFLSECLTGIKVSKEDTAINSSDLSALNSRTETMDPMLLIEVLNDLNTLAADTPGDPGAITIAAKAMVRLTYTSYDLMETADIIDGNALGLLVLAQVLGHDALALEESMLAYSMGYSAHAESLLPQVDNEAWRSFLNKDDLQLAVIARDADADSLDKFLWLKRFVQSDRHNDWWKIITHYFNSAQRSFYAISTGAQLSNFGFKSDILHLMPYLVFSQVVANLDPESRKLLEERDIKDDKSGFINNLLSLINSRLEIPRDKLLDIFEEKLMQASRKYHGPYFYKETYQAYFSGYFYSSFYGLGLHYLDNYSSINAAEKYSKVLGGSGSDTARQFKVWYANLVATENGRADVNTMIADLQGLKSFGLPPLLRTVEAVLPVYAFGKPEKNTIVSFLFDRMDSRIRHRYKYAEISRKHLLDLIRAEYVYKTILRDEAGTNRSLAAWLAKYFDQPEGILQVAEDKNAPVKARAYALELLADFPEYEDAIWRLLKQLRHESPDEWRVFEAYFKIADKYDEHKQIIRLANVWLGKEYINPNQFNKWKATIAKSVAQRNLGDLEGAWDTIEPIIPSKYGPALRHGVDIILELGQIEAAEKIAKTSLKRYPNSIKGLGKSLKAMWVNKKYKEAAKVASEWRYPSTAEDWRWIIGKDMVSALAGDRKSSAEMTKALKAAGLEDWKLRELAVMAADQEQYGVAYEIQSRLTFPGPGQLAYDIETYNYLKILEGRTAAVKWISARIPRGYRNYSSMAFYGEGEIDLLWHLIPDPDRERYGDAVWLYRAAAYIEGYPISEQQKSELINYYKNSGNSYYQLLGKFLMGFAEQDTLLQRSMDIKQINEVTYYLGIKALNEGRYYDAADWFRASINTGQFNSGEYRWAYDYLYRFMSGNQSLGILAAKGKLIRKFEN